jgi:hypothetical protein
MYVAVIVRAITFPSHLEVIHRPIRASDGQMLDVAYTCDEARCWTWVLEEYPLTGTSVTTIEDGVELEIFRGYLKMNFSNGYTFPPDCDYTVLGRLNCDLYDSVDAFRRLLRGHLRNHRSITEHDSLPFLPGNDWRDLV